MNDFEKIAKTNIYHAFNWIVGGYYNCIQDGEPEYLPKTKQDLEDEIYESALNNKYGEGYEGYGKAPREMRFAGSKFCKAYIRELMKSDGDVEEIAEVARWGGACISD